MPWHWDGSGENGPEDDGTAFSCLVLNLNCVSHLVVFNPLLPYGL